MDDQRTAIVTGAASGIGRATVERLLTVDAYDRITAFDIDESVREGFDTSVVTHVVDVADPIAVEDAVAALESDGTVESVANCAGISQSGWIDEISPDDWDRVVDVNLKARSTSPARPDRPCTTVVVVRP